MSCPQCMGIEQEFGAKRARRELKRLVRRGVSGTTRMLVDTVIGRGIRGRTFLDIGGGVGAIQHALMEAGASSGTSADASSAYLETARSEAERQGYANRMTYVSGDFLDASPDIAPADVVTLDRAICCYDDMPGLVDASARRALSLWGAVIPRDERLAVRLGIGMINLAQRIRGRPMRVFAHARTEVDRLLRRLGFSPSFRGTSFFWQVLVYERTPVDASSTPSAAPPSSTA